MAANYWTSTQYKFWSFTPEKLAELRDDLQKSQATPQGNPYPDRRLMFVFLRDRLLQLGKRLQFRQQCVATAMVYMQRYFLSTPIQNVNLYLLVATSFYLASKTEESPHHIRLIASEARQSWPDFVPGDVSRLGEMEFCLISDMRSQLIVWHPYRTLIELKDNHDLKLNNDELGLAWMIVNDSYMTDLPLTCPPHVVAVIAVFLAIIFQPSTKTSGIRQLSSDVSMEPNTFPSIGGRPGMAGVLGSAMQGLPKTPSSSAPSNTNGYSNGASRFIPTSSDRIATLIADEGDIASAIQSSDKFQNTVKFLIESDVDLKQMIEGTQQIISLYTLWEQYSEKSIKDSVSRWLKEKSLLL